MRSTERRGRIARAGILVVLLAAGCAGQRPGSVAACPDDGARIAAAAQRTGFDAGTTPREFLSRSYSAAAVIAGDEGKVYDRDGYAASIEHQIGGNDTQRGGPPTEIAVRFADGLAILTFVSHMHNIDRSTGAVQEGTFRESRVFACEGGEWKVVFRAEVQRPNALREPVWPERAKFADYVGRYRIQRDGPPLGDIEVKLVDGKLMESWGDKPPDELLPGGHDTFFVRDDGTVEQFVRDASQRVVGIHYIFWDDHYEARRAD